MSEKLTLTLADIEKFREMQKSVLTYNGRRAYTLEFLAKDIPLLAAAEYGLKAQAFLNDMAKFSDEGWQGEGTSCDLCKLDPVTHDGPCQHEFCNLAVKAAKAYGLEVE